MPEDRVLRRIEEFSGSDALVAVKRQRGWDRIDGSIQAVGRKWLLMGREFDAGFNGHSLIRIAQIRDVAAQPGARFVTQSLALEANWPLPRLDGVDLTSTRTILESVARSAPLVTVYYEALHPHECLIGVPRRFRRRRFRLRTVDPGAEWDRDDTEIRYRSVSRIEVGGAYERRLAAIAGPPD